MEREVQMAEARHEQFWLALYGEHTRNIHERDGETETCPVCGDLCAVKMVNELIGTDKKCKGKQQEKK
ncbi:MAG: phosphomethylpyrimidine synthase ThiC [Methanoregula sp.]